MDRTSPRARHESFGSAGPTRDARQQRHTAPRLTSNSVGVSDARPRGRRHERSRGRGAASSSDTGRSGRAGPVLAPVHISNGRHSGTGGHRHSRHGDHSSGTRRHSGRSGDTNGPTRQLQRPSLGQLSLPGHGHSREGGLRARDAAAASAGATSQSWRPAPLATSPPADACNDVLHKPLLHPSPVKSAAGLLLGSTNGSGSHGATTPPPPADAGGAVRRSRPSDAGNSSASVRGHDTAAAGQSTQASTTSPLGRAARPSDQTLASTMSRSPDARRRAPAKSLGGGDADDTTTAAAASDVPAAPAGPPARMRQRMLSTGSSTRSVLSLADTDSGLEDDWPRTGTVAGAPNTPTPTGSMTSSTPRSRAASLAAMASGVHSLSPVPRRAHRHARKREALVAALAESVASLIERLEAGTSTAAAAAGGGGSATDTAGQGPVVTVPVDEVEAVVRTLELATTALGGKFGWPALSSDAISGSPLSHPRTNDGLSGARGTTGADAGAGGVGAGRDPLPRHDPLHHAQVNRYLQQAYAPAAPPGAPGTPRSATPDNMALLQLRRRGNAQHARKSSKMNPWGKGSAAGGSPTARRPSRLNPNAKTAAATAVQSPLVSASVPEMQHIDSWSFDVFKVAAVLSSRTMAAVGSHLFDDHALCVRFNIAPATLQAFLAAVEAGYHDNPYHNHLHAADVAQTIHYFLHAGGMDRWLSDTMVLAAITAALVHDIGHPGVNNGYLVATQHRLALRYNDSSPLENMHIATAFEIMSTQRGCNILSELSRDERGEVRKAMIDMVLATDNAVHSKYMHEVTEYLHEVAEAEAAAQLVAVSEDEPGAGSSVGTPVSAGGSELTSSPDQSPRQSLPRSQPPSLLRQSFREGLLLRRGTSTGSMASLLSNASPLCKEEAPVPEERLTLVLQIALHAADVSNPAKEWELYNLWVARIEQEFYEQGDLEREADIPVTPIFDRLNPIPRAKLQTGFTKGVVQPLYTALGAIPGVEIGVCLAQIEANLDAWAREQEGALVPPPMTDARAPAGSDGVHTPTPQPATPDSTHSPAPLSPRTPTSSRSPAALAVGGVARQHRGFASVSGGADRAAAPAAAVDSPIPEDDIDALIAALGTEVTEGGSASGPGSAVGGASSHSSGTGRGRYNSHGGGRSSPPGLVLDSAASSLPSGPASTRSGLAVSPLGRRSASGHSGGARDGDSTRAAAGASPGGARTRFSPSGSPQRRESGSATRESQRSGGAPTPGIGLPAGASAGAGGAGGGASGGGAGRRRSSVASNFALLSPEMWQELEGDLSPSRQAWGSALRPRTSSSTNGHGRPPPSR